MKDVTPISAERHFVTSICMATYNGEKFLREQVESILSQMGEQDELVVVDDASKDGSVSYLESICDPRIKVYINKSNVGHVQSFARAIGLARGHYILMSDQDDVWVEGRLHAMCAILTGGSALVSSNSEFIDGEGVIISGWKFPSDLREVDSSRHLKNIFRIFAGNAFYYGCCMGLREELRSFILPIPKYVESHDLWIAMIGNMARSNHHLESITLRRRLHASNATEFNRSLSKKVLSRGIFIVSMIHIYFRLISRSIASGGSM